MGNVQKGLKKRAYNKNCVFKPHEMPTVVLMEHYSKASKRSFKELILHGFELLIDELEKNPKEQKKLERCMVKTCKDLGTKSFIDNLELNHEERSGTLGSFQL